MTPAPPQQTCPACGHPTQPDAVFCASCGLLLTPGASIPPAASTEPVVPVPPPAGARVPPPPPPAGPARAAELPPTAAMAPVGPPTRVMPVAPAAAVGGPPRRGPGPPWWLLALAAILIAAIAAGVIAIATGGDDDTAQTLPSTLPPATVEGASTTAGAVPATSGPATSTSPASPASTAAPTTTGAPTSTSAPATSTTAAPTSAPVTPGGDLAIPGRPMQRPACDDSFITVMASAVGVDVAKVGVPRALDQYGGNYLRTDETCPSLRPDVNGNPIYVVYHGPFLTSPEACAARAAGPRDAYVRQLSTTLGSNHVVDCD